METTEPYNGTYSYGLDVQNIVKSRDGLMVCRAASLAAGRVFEPRLALLLLLNVFFQNALDPRGSSTAAPPSYYETTYRPTASQA